MSDLIDRQAAIDAICNEWCGVSHKDCIHPFNLETDDYYWCDGCETVLNTLPNLPSAEPERKCKSCRYRNLEWDDEPCDSCTMGGEGCHYKPERKKV